MNIENCQECKNNSIYANSITYKNYINKMERFNQECFTWLACEVVLEPLEEATFDKYQASSIETPYYYLYVQGVDKMELKGHIKVIRDIRIMEDKVNDILLER